MTLTPFSRAVSEPDVNQGCLCQTGTGWHTKLESSCEGGAQAGEGTADLLP